MPFNAFLGVFLALASVFISLFAIFYVVNCLLVFLLRSWLVAPTHSPNPSLAPPGERGELLFVGGRLI